MRVFVTGGTGFVGSHIVKALLNANHEVTVLSRNPSANVQGASLAAGDLEDTEGYVRLLAGQQVLIHNAIVWDEAPTEYLLKDPLATVRLLRASADAGIARVMYTSSLAVCGGSAQADAHSPAIPKDMYGATKAVGEALVFGIAAESDMRATVIRCGPAVGSPAFPGGPHKSDRRLAQVVREVLAFQDPAIPDAARQFSPVTGLALDFVGAIASSADRNIVLATGTELVPWSNVLSVVQRVLEESRSATRTPAPPDGGPAFHANPDLYDHIRHLVMKEN